MTDQLNLLRPADDPVEKQPENPQDHPSGQLVELPGESFEDIFGDAA